MPPRTIEMRPIEPPPFLTFEQIEKITGALAVRYRGFLRVGEHFLVAGEALPDAWTIVVTFENADRSLHLPVELAMLPAENPGMRIDGARDALVDFADFFFDSYFRGGRDVTLPLDWMPVPFGEFTLRARGWERNLLLEDAADRLLAGEPVEAVMESLRR